jgi:hypothetical protein
MFSSIVLVVSALLPALSGAQQLLRDPGIAGPPLELVHLFNDQWPTGTTQSSSENSGFDVLTLIRYNCVAKRP